MKISKEVKTGTLVILGIVLFIFGFNYLKGKNLLESENVYYTEFDYNALSKSSVVTVKGNTVGKVQDIVYDYKTGKTRVSFTVNEALHFSKNSTVKMYETGLMGGNGLAILVSEEGEQAKPGDFLHSEVEFGLVTTLSKNFSGLSNDLNSTLKSTDTFVRNLNSFVVDESEQGLKQTLAELNVTLKSFKNTSNTINSTITKNEKNITETLENFKTTSGELSLLITELREANMSTMVANLNKTMENLNSILAALEQGEGTMGKLLKDESLYTNLEGATKEMEELLRDIKLHPKRYFRILSKKEIPYKKE